MVIESLRTFDDRINGEPSTMMKLTTKFLVGGAVVAAVIAMSAAPSDAAKRRAAASKACAFGTNCSSNCANGWCSVYVCGQDGKFAPAVFTPVCVDAWCVNKQKKC